MFVWRGNKCGIRFKFELRWMLCPPPAGNLEDYPNWLPTTSSSPPLPGPSTSRHSLKPQDLSGASLSLTHRKILCKYGNRGEICKGEVSLCPVGNIQHNFGAKQPAR